MRENHLKWLSVVRSAGKWCRPHSNGLMGPTEFAVQSLFARIICSELVDSVLAIVRKLCSNTEK